MILHDITFTLGHCVSTTAMVVPSVLLSQCTTVIVCYTTHVLELLLVVR